MPNYGAWEFIAILTITILIFSLAFALSPKAIAWFINQIRKSL